MKKCNHCGVKPLSEFGSNKRFKDGLQPICKKCKLTQDLVVSKSQDGVVRRAYYLQVHQAYH